MARQKLINLHSGTQKEDAALTTAGLALGEIAVQHTAKNPELIIKTGENTYAHFADKTAISKEIDDDVKVVDGALETLKTNLGDYKTAANIAKVGTDAVSSANAYTDGLITGIKGSGYAEGTTLASLQSEISAIAGTGETSISDLKEQVDANEEAITSNKETISTNTTAISNIKDSLGASDATAAADGSAYARIKKNAEDIATLTTTTASHTTSIGENSGKISAINTNITTLSGSVVTNQSDISGLKKTVEGHTTKLSDLQNDIDNKIAGVYKVKGSVKTVNNLPTGATEGDVYNVQEASGNTPAGTNYVWVAGKEGGEDAHWDALGGTVDLSVYYTKEDVDKEISAKTSLIETELSGAKTTIETHKTSLATITGWKINGSGLSATFNLNGSNIMTAADGSETINAAIAAAKKAGTDAAATANSIKTELLGTSADTSAEATIHGAKKGVTEAKETASAAQTAADKAQTRANKGITKITTSLTDGPTSGVSFGASTTAASSGDVETTITLNLSEMVIDCGEY